MKIIYILLFTAIFTNHFNLLAQNNNTLSKLELIELYKKLYQATDIDSIIWTNNGKCDCGQIDSIIYKYAENRINFFRITAGLDTIKINPKFNLEAQNAAFLVKINNKLTHYPDKTWECFGESAANGCKKSSLGFSNFKDFKETSFISHFIADYGDDNYFVGHRKWILYTKLTAFGYGATNSSEAVLVADGISFEIENEKLPEFIAYPWSGYVPVNLIFPKWSFSIPENKKVDFSKTTISMYDHKGRLIKIKKLEEKKLYLDHTIVWTATGLFSDFDILYGKNNLEANGYLDKKIKVVIKNVKIDGKMKSFKYFVAPIKI